MHKQCKTGPSALLGVGLAGLLCMCSLAGAAERVELSELPIGHLKITEYDQGKINVEARCVPAMDLLNALAQRTGNAIVFEIPLPTYVSVYMPWIQAEPKFWIARAASAASVRCDDVEGKWHVRARAHTELYDPSLDEAEVMQRCKSQTEPTKAGQGIDGKAILIIGGRYVPPPYEVKGSPIGENGYSVTVNGLEFSRTALPAATVAKGVPDLPDSGQFDDYEDMDRYIAHRLYPTVLAQQGSAKALEEVVLFLKSQQIVGDVMESNPLRIRLAGKYGYRNVFPSDYDFATGKQKDWEAAKAPRETVLLADEIANAVTGVQGFLGQSGVSIRGSGGGTVVFRHPAQLKDFANKLSLAQKFSLLQRECLFAEVVNDRCIARELAVNLMEDKDALSAMLGFPQSGNKISGTQP